MNGISVTPITLIHDFRHDESLKQFRQRHKNVLISN